MKQEFNKDLINKGLKHGDNDNEFRTNLKYILCYVCALTLGSFHAGYSISATNSLFDTFDLKFDWQTQEEQDFYQSMIGSAGILGLMLGSLYAGKLISFGRRRAFIFAIWISLFGVIII